MSLVCIAPSRLCGRVRIPPSKSMAHRAILCAALSRGACEIAPIALSDDIRATIGAVEALGVKTTLVGDTLFLDARGLFSEKRVTIDCGESGSTLRFLIPIAAAGGICAHFTGRGRLPERPLGPYLECLPAAGATVQSSGGLPLSLSGGLQSGVFRLPGGVSSQFVTGLLLALPLLEGESRIVLNTPLESAGYVAMTIAVMRDFGVDVFEEPGGYRIPGNQRYTPRRYGVEGDWSQAAFFLAAGALGGDLALEGLRPNSLQGDRAAFALFTAMGARLSWEGDLLLARGGGLSGIEVDASQIPDLVPILAATAALAEGRTVIGGAARLRIKESDRLRAMCAGINALGGKAEERPDGLLIEGIPLLAGGRAEGFGDHRIVMALAVAALRAKGKTEITDAQSIAKSYPDFFEHYTRLGGNAHVVDLG